MSSFLRLVEQATIFMIMPPQKYLTSYTTVATGALDSGNAGSALRGGIVA